MTIVGSNISTGSSGGLHHEIQETITQMELLKVSELKAICRSIELPITGRKSILQDRIRAYLKNSCSIGRIDPWRPKTIQILIEKSKLGQALPKYELLWQAIRSGAFNHPIATGQLPVSSLQNDPFLSINQVNGDNSGTVRPSDVNIGQFQHDLITTPKKTYIHFKESPFYKIKKLIPETAQKINITNVRGVCLCKFKFTKADWNLLQGEKKFKLYLFCGAANPSGAIGNEPIQFPHPNEIRFNETQIKDNVRGLKNKLGTAKPADLTPYLRPSPEQNVLEIVYAFTKNEFFTYCYIVEEVSAEELLQDVLKHPKIIKAATLHYIKQTMSEEEEEELITTSTVMSLQCPVSYTRMKYPVKSIMCKHLQCFDALWYIYSQAQIPTWQCPVCQIDVNLKDLAVSEFVDEILKNSDEDIEQVELSSDGSWKPVIEESTAKPNEKSNESTGTSAIVKTENGYDDLDNIPLSKQTGTSSKTTSSEPIVISLDSDSEDNDQNNQTGNMDTENMDVVSNETVRHNNNDTQTGIYMDSSSNPSETTLDPRNQGSITPMNKRGEIDRPNTSANFTDGRNIPNMLDKTPLNNNLTDHDSSLPEANSSPTLSDSIGSLYGPIHDPNISAAIPFDPSPLGSRSVNIQRDSDSSISTANYMNQDDPNISATKPFDPSPLGSRSVNIQRDSDSSISTANHMNHDDQNNLAQITPAASNSILGLTGNSIAPPLPPINDHSAINSSIPQLPPLPTQRLMATTDNSISNGNPRYPLNGNSNAVHGRSKKPIVSPFIPKRPYLNILPQKRHASNKSSTPQYPSPTSNGNYGSEGNNSWTPPVADTASSRDDSIIDLTSD